MQNHSTHVSSHESRFGLMIFIENATAPRSSLRDRGSDEGTRTVRRLKHHRVRAGAGESRSLAVRRSGVTRPGMQDSLPHLQKARSRAGLGLGAKPRAPRRAIIDSESESESRHRDWH